MKYEKCPICGETVQAINEDYGSRVCKCGIVFFKVCGELKCIIRFGEFTETSPVLLHTFARKAFLAAREMQTHDLKYKYEWYDEWGKTL